MKIAHLFESDVEEARRGNWGREQSRATGQQLGKDIAAGLPSAGQQAAIKTGKAQAAQGQAQADLQARLAQRKAQKAAPTAQPAAPAQGTPATQAAPAQSAAPAATGAAPSKTLGQRVAGAVKGVSNVVGAVGGGVRQAGSELVKGYQAGRQAVATGGKSLMKGGSSSSEPVPGADPVQSRAAPTQQAAPAATGGGTAGGGGAATPKGNIIAQLTGRVDALEKAVGIAEEFKFESKFLGMKI